LALGGRGGDADRHPVAPSAGAAACSVSTRSRPCAIAMSRRTSGQRDTFAELEELRGQRRLLRVVLPRGVAGDRAPLFNGRLVEIEHLGALLGIDVGDFLIVGYGLRGAELFHFDAER